MKPRSFRRILQDQYRFLSNMDLPGAWTASLIRIPPGLVGPFLLKVPEPWPWPEDQCRLIYPKTLNRNRSIEIMGDKIELFAFQTARYPGQVAAILVCQSEAIRAAARDLIEVVASPADELAQTLRITGAEVPPGPPDPVPDPAGTPCCEDRKQPDPQGDETPENRRAQDEWGQEFLCPPGALSRSILSGNVDAAFEEALTIVSTRVDFRDFQALAHENRGALAEWQGHIMTVWCSTSWPHLVRRCVSEATGLAQRHIRIHSLPSRHLPDRFLLDSSLLASWAAMAALGIQGRVRLFTHSQEDQEHGTRDGQASILIQSAHDAEGRLKGLRSRIRIDTGAMAVASDLTMQMSLLGMCCTYRCANQYHQICLDSSPNPPRFQTSMLGMNHSIQAMEQHVQQICRVLGQDPLSWRQSHILARGDHTPYGLNTETLLAPRGALRKLDINSDFSRNHGALEVQNQRRRLGGELLGDSTQSRGIGLALGFQSHGLLVDWELDNRARIGLELGEDGHLTIHAPLHPLNSGVQDAWTAAIASLLGLEEKNISFAPFSSETLEDTGPARFSRLASLYSPLIPLACRSLKGKMAQSRRPVFVRSTWVRSPHAAWNSQTMEGQPFLGRSWAAASIALQLDRVELALKVQEVHLVVNCGSILNSQVAKSRLRQSIMACLDWLCDSAEDAGARTWGSHTHRECRILIDLENDQGLQDPRSHLTHAGGLGDLVYSCVPAAFTNALGQILGQMPDRSPMEAGHLARYLYPVPQEAKA